MNATAAHRKDLGKMATLEHRHFATIATIIDKLAGQFSIADHMAIAEHFADELKATNPKFDRKRFMLACGYTS